MMNKILKKYIAAVQKVLITALLCCVYVIGFGATAAYLAVFRRALFFGGDWKQARGYEADADECEKES